MARWVDGMAYDDEDVPTKEDELTELEYLRLYRDISLSVLNKHMIALINRHVAGESNKSIPEEYDFDD